MGGGAQQEAQQVCQLPHRVLCLAFAVQARVAVC
jgi:hypothetical protein